MLGSTIIHTRKEYQSYFSLPSEMLQLQPKLASMRVFGSDLEKYVFKPFSNLFPTAIHLLCDLNIKDNIQNKLQDLQFQNSDIKKGLVDSGNVEEFDGCYEER